MTHGGTDTLWPPRGILEHSNHETHLPWPLYDEARKIVDMQTGMPQPPKHSTGTGQACEQTF